MPFLWNIWCTYIHVNSEFAQRYYSDTTRTWWRYKSVTSRLYIQLLFEVNDRDCCYFENTTLYEQAYLSKIYAFYQEELDLCISVALQWRHNERDGLSVHQCLHCSLNCCFRHRPKKTSKLRVTRLARPVTRKMFPFDDVIMVMSKLLTCWWLRQTNRSCHGEIRSCFRPTR